VEKGLIDINATVIDYEKILDAPISALDVVNVMLTLFQRPISMETLPPQSMQRLPH
jgi:hypothetical protein